MANTSFGGNAEKARCSTRQSESRKTNESLKLVIDFLRWSYCQLPCVSRYFPGQALGPGEVMKGGQV